MTYILGDRQRFWFCALIALAIGCGDDGSSAADAPGPGVITTGHCTYQPVAATSGNGGTVEAGPLMAGAADTPLHVPVGTALGAYTARATTLGGGGDNVDSRKPAISGEFNPSIGMETVPRAKALALTAGGETVVIIKLDIGLMYEAMVFDLEARLGAEFAGKVLLSVSHSHSGWGQFSGHSGLMVGVGQYRTTVFDAILDQLEAVANEALANRRPAQLGIFVDRNFDPNDDINRDRRGENDELMGGPRKDDTLVMIRVDGTDGAPIAALPIFGVHGTLNDSDNNITATDAPGGIDRLFEEEFDQPVVVMHLQSAAGDVSPRGYGGVDCSIKPGNPDDPCFEWLKAEGHGRTAAPVMLAAWQAAGADMRAELEIEMLTRSIELGPRAETFAIRGGALEYAPFDLARDADGQIFDGNGDVISPIDEFNAPVGAALCQDDNPIVPNGFMPGTAALIPYGSCTRIDAAATFLGTLLKIEFDASETQPICQSTRTTVSALRLGDYVIGTLPGEPTVMAVDLVRDNSPVAPENTIVIGYAQGHIGYLLRPEDWLRGGYEPSIGFWGPLEAEYVIERLVELMPLAMTPEREDGAAGGSDRLATMRVADGLEADDPAAMAGTIPAPVPEEIWLRTGTPASAQPDATITRVDGIATFVWIGDDPLVATPVVTLERETAPGVFEPVRRRSGRVVDDGDIVISYTPQPVRRDGPQTHFWVAEWQAVPWLGARADNGSSLHGLDARAGVPLGRYRFRAVGKEFDITSDPFDVAPGTLGVAATREGSTIHADITIHAPRGYRLLDMSVDSNTPVPVRSGTMTVELVRSGGQTSSSQVAVDSNGRVSVDAGGTAGDVVQVRVIDPFGNTGNGSL